jgi:hypothetical protein
MGAPGKVRQEKHARDAGDVTVNFGLHEDRRANDDPNHHGGSVEQADGTLQDGQKREAFTAETLRFGGKRGEPETQIPSNVFSERCRSLGLTFLHDVPALLKQSQQCVSLLFRCVRPRLSGKTRGALRSSSIARRHGNEFHQFQCDFILAAACAGRRPRGFG